MDFVAPDEWLTHLSRHLLFLLLKIEILVEINLLSCFGAMLERHDSAVGVINHVIPFGRFLKVLTLISVDYLFFGLDFYQLTLVLGTLGLGAILGNVAAFCVNAFLLFWG